MKIAQKRGFLSGRVLYLNTDNIWPNAAQPRRYFDEDALAELAESIRQHGVLQPLTVRRTADGYELVAGERRLRAAILAGLREVPCLLMAASDNDLPLLALVENIQRRDLHYLEESLAIAELIRTYGLSQEQVAEKLGKSQSAIANKLRLLRLSPACAEQLHRYNLSERHARALLRLEDDEERLAVLQEVVAGGYSVAQTEACVEKHLAALQTTPPRRRPTYVIKDVRLFLNSLRRQMDLMQRAGVRADCERTDTDDEIRLLIRIPRQEPEKKLAEFASKITC